MSPLYRVELPPFSTYRTSDLIELYLLYLFAVLPCSLLLITYYFVYFCILSFFFLFFFFRTARTLPCSSGQTAWPYSSTIFPETGERASSSLGDRFDGSNYEISDIDTSNYEISDIDTSNMKYRTSICRNLNIGHRFIEVWNDGHRSIEIWISDINISYRAQFLFEFPGDRYGRLQCFQVSDRTITGDHS